MCTKKNGESVKREKARIKRGITKRKLEDIDEFHKVIAKAKEKHSQR